MTLKISKNEKSKQNLVQLFVEMFCSLDKKFLNPNLPKPADNNENGWKIDNVQEESSTKF